MEKLVDRTLIFLKFSKASTPPLCVMYLLAWHIRFFDEETFNIVDKFFGAVPRFFDKIMPMTQDLHGMEVTMGYVLTAGFVAILAHLSFKYENKLSKYRKILKDEELKKRFDDQQAIKIQKQKKEEEKLEQMTMFFGLLEFDLKYYDPLFKDERNLDKLKFQYANMVSAKLLKKYPKIIFETSNKLFFTCKNFSKFHTIIQDIVKLYHGFLAIGKKKNIKTDILLSFWAGNKGTNPKEAFKILNSINKLGYKNKIVMSGGVYFRYQKEPVKHFDFISLGVSKLLGVCENGDDLDINLICIRNVK